jgi:hypothetical protein
MTQKLDQWIRKVGLFLYSTDKILDLSELRIKFNVVNADVESPNSCAIRVYNLSEATMTKVCGGANRGEFNRVSLNAGYSNGNYGVIFEGTIKQFRIGRENPTTSYLDIFAADADVGYNQAVVNAAIAAGATPLDALKVGTKSMSDVQAKEIKRLTGVAPNGDPISLDASSFTVTKQNVPSLRGQVLFGMARVRMRHLANTLDVSWSIQNGKVVLLDNKGYRDDQIVEINIATGMIGMPEQTDGGIRVKCLLNSRLRIGGLIKLNNKEIIQLLQKDPNAAPIPYNQWSGFQHNAPISADGYYRMYVVEHEGDTRGNVWHSDLVCLAVDISAPQATSVKS